MELNQTGHPSCQMSHSATFLAPTGHLSWPHCCSLCTINDIMSDIESEIRLFANDCVCYREIKDVEDTLKHQKDIDRLGTRARKYGMRFQPVKWEPSRN